MKTLLIIAVITVALWGILAHYFPDTVPSLPLWDTVTGFCDRIGLSAAAGKLFAAGKDISKTATAHHFDGWHLAVIVLVVLIARKLVIMLLR